MAKIIDIPDNLIGKRDTESIESFAAHEIALGRATRFHWSFDENDDPVFELYRGGIDEKLVITLRHSRKDHEFQAFGKDNKLIVAGTLDHVMMILDQKLRDEHDESQTSA